MLFDYRGYRIFRGIILDIIMFVGKNSLWIYLIHIAFLRFLPLLSDIHWILQWGIVSVASCLACYLKNFICFKINKKNSKIFMYLMG